MAKTTKKQKSTKVYTLELTRKEITHLRNLFGVKFPQQETPSLSQQLAETTKLTHTESELWAKLVNVASEAKVRLGDRAPDFVIASVDQPVLGVYQLTDASVEDEGVEGTIFG
jgi:hypothetical protein